MINSPKELGKKLKSDPEEIKVEVDLGKKIVKIKATGKVSWAIAIGAIGVAVTAFIAAPATAGVSSVVAMTTAPAAVSILGISTTTAAISTAAISTAVAGGGTLVLNKLRKYDLVETNASYMVFRRK